MKTQEKYLNSYSINGEKTAAKINKARVNDVYLEAVDFISDLIGVDPVEMMQKNRRRDLTTARHALSYYLRKHTDLSFQAIGNLMGGKHHATILHGCKLIEESAPYNFYIRTIKEAIDELKMSNNRTLRQEILRCLGVYSNDNTRTAAIIRVINKYVKPNQLKNERH
jgi:hypothetical protein